MNSQSRSPTQDGFTLLEILVAVSVAGILAAAAAPGLQRIQREWTLWGAARQVERSLHWGRMNAITSNRPLSLLVEREGRRFLWRDADTKETLLQSVSDFQGRARLVSHPRRPLTFHPSGHAAPAGSFTVGDESGQYRVIVNFIGRVRFERIRSTP